MGKISLKCQNYARYFILLDLVVKTTLQRKNSPFTARETGSEILNGLLEVPQPEIGKVNLSLDQSKAEYEILCDPAGQLPHTFPEMHTYVHQKTCL